MKTILLGVSSSVAIYKMPDLIRLLRQEGFAVETIMTQASTELLSPLLLQAVSGKPVRSELFDAQAEAAMGHIELARSADLMLIAPATADILAKLAHGFADDLLTTCCLATKAPVLMAPAMNTVMWDKPVTQANLQKLQDYGFHLCPPESGELACGEVGVGRLAALDTIVEHVKSLL